MRLLYLLCFTLLATLPAASHEFWVEPKNFQVKSGDEVIANLRNGQNFKGGALSWFDARIVRSEVWIDDQVNTLSGRAGDLPALRIDTGALNSKARNGLLRVVHQTRREKLTYTEVEKFTSFVTEKDLPENALVDAAYPLVEGYTRYAKSLIALGSGSGDDGYVGLEAELVALKNPYDLQRNQQIEIQLLIQGEPRADTQVIVFERAADRTVIKQKLRTDEMGIVRFKSQRAHTYLVDAVLLRKPKSQPESTKPLDWESLWASLTFYVP